MGRATLGLANARYRLPDLEIELAESSRRERDARDQSEALRGENDALRTRAEDAEAEMERLRELLAANLGAKDAEKKLAKQREMTMVTARAALVVGDAALEAAAAACRDAATLPNVHHLVGLSLAPVEASSESPPTPPPPQLSGASGGGDDDDEEEAEDGASGDERRRRRETRTKGTRTNARARSRRWARESDGRGRED